MISAADRLRCCQAPGSLQTSSGPSSQLDHTVIAAGHHVVLLFSVGMISAASANDR
jgi:hypothetical protein